jgi:hypothetical protein
MNDNVPEKLREQISALPRDIEPSRDLWPAIRSEAERVAMTATPDAPRRFPKATLVRFAVPIAAAAILALVALLVWPRSEASGPGWTVDSLAGSPRIGDKALTGAGRWREGQWLETDAHSRARFDVGLIGEVQLEPNTRLRLLNASETDHRLELARGTMSVLIWAPPRLFFVETPSATAVDLGCAYTLTVDDNGAGILHVTSGYVALVHHDLESIIPAGLMCVTRPDAGPGTPFAAGASEEFRAALDRFDFKPAQREAALGVVLAQAGEADRVTLWHLLERAPTAQRGAVFDSLAKFAPPPADVTREGLIAGDATMRDRWAFDLGLVPAGSATTEFPME